MDGILMYDISPTIRYSVAFFIVVITAIAFVYGLKRSKQLRKTFENQALKRGGITSDSFRYLRLFFDYKGKTVTVSAFFRQ